MRHLWLCIIDGCLVRSGPIQPGDTMPILEERLMKVLPHLSADGIKVISEDGRIFDSELWFSTPAPGEVGSVDNDDLLMAVGVVNGHVGVKAHRGKTVEEILGMEAATFSGRISDDTDFGVFSLSGDQLASIEDIIVILGPEAEPAGRPSGGSSGGDGRYSHSRRGGMRRGRPPRHRNDRGPGRSNEGNAPAEGASNGSVSERSSEAPSDSPSQAPEQSPPPAPPPSGSGGEGQH